MIELNTIGLPNQPVEVCFIYVLISKVEKHQH